MIALQEQVGLSIKARRLFRARQQILVAVSGGVDSMVLLHVLHELSREAGWELTVAHLNHQLRGSSSMADEWLVRRTARDLRLPVAVTRADVRAFGKERKVSIEMAARKLRHDFLARIAAQSKIPSIALAHHRDDQVELFFLRLLRGSSGEGLAGMKWSSASPSNAAIKLVRPLLDCSKETLHEYAIEQGIQFRNDSSNSCLDFQRNRIRHELLPLLRREYQPGVGKNVLRVMDILRAESEFVTATAESWLLENQNNPSDRGSNKKNGPKCLGGTDPKSAQQRPALVLARFEDLPVAIQRRCVQLQLVRQGIVPDFDLVEHLRLQPLKPINISKDRVKACGDGAVSLGRLGEAGGSVLRLVREAKGMVQLCPLAAAPFLEGCLQLDLGEAPGGIDWEQVRFAWRIQAIKGRKRPKKEVGTEDFDADQVGATVFIRHWRPGDRFRPIGMERAAKLQDLFVNQKVPRERRRQLMVAGTIQGELFWVEGLRMSDRFKLTSSTIRRLHWAWQRL